MIGSLRESVSQLESKNQKLDRRVADLTTENRSLENRLIEEEAHSRELAQRLNDARLAAGSGGETTSRSANTRRTQPAARSGSSRAPFAQIHSDIQPFDDAPKSELEPSRTGPSRSANGTESELFPSSDDLGLQGRRDDRQTRWLFATKPDSESTVR